TCYATVVENNVTDYSKSADGGVREDSFTRTSANMAQNCHAKPGRHLALTVKFIPRTVGMQHATVTVFHDGNEQGFTSFVISGETFRDVSVQATDSNPYLAATEVKPFNKMGLIFPAQKKTIYMKMSGTFGAV